MENKFSTSNDSLLVLGTFKCLLLKHIPFIYGLDVLLFVYSACGEIRTCTRVPVLTAYFPVLAKSILENGGLFVAPTLEDCLTRLTGSSTQAGTGNTDLQLFGLADSLALT